jgi:hypothetical protein
LGTGSLQQFIVHLNEIVKSSIKNTKDKLKWKNQKCQYETGIPTPPFAEITAAEHFAFAEAVQKNIKHRALELQV